MEDPVIGPATEAVLWWMYGQHCKRRSSRRSSKKSRSKFYKDVLSKTADFYVVEIMMVRVNYNQIRLFEKFFIEKGEER